MNFFEWKIFFLSHLSIFSTSLIIFSIYLSFFSPSIFLSLAPSLIFNYILDAAPTATPGFDRQTSEAASVTSATAATEEQPAAAVVEQTPAVQG